jgi:hypothetical protein
MITSVSSDSFQGYVSLAAAAAVGKNGLSNRKVTQLSLGRLSSQLL